MHYINATLLLGLALAIVRMYVWVSAELKRQEVRILAIQDIVTNHRLEADVHVDVKDLVRSGDCDGRFGLIKIETDHIKEGLLKQGKQIDHMRDEIHTGFDRVVDALDKKAGG